MESNNVNLNAGKDFSASPDVLYKAWTDPEQLKQWWKPMGSQLTEVVNELREGGKIEYKFQTEGKDNLVITGEYLEVQPNEKLVYTWNWQVLEDTVNDSNYNLTVEFKAAETGSSIDISQEKNDKQEAIQPHQHGWEEALNHLAEFLESHNTQAEPGSMAGTASDAQGKPDNESQDPATV